MCIFREGSLEGHVLGPEGPGVRTLRGLALSDSSGFRGKRAVQSGEPPQGWAWNFVLPSLASYKAQP